MLLPGFGAYLRHSAKIFAKTFVSSVAQAHRKTILARQGPNRPVERVARLAVKQTSIELACSATLPSRLAVVFDSSEDAGRATYGWAAKASLAENTAIQAAQGLCFSIATSAMPSGHGFALFSDPHARCMGRIGPGMSDTCRFTAFTSQSMPCLSPVACSFRPSPAPNLKQALPLLSRYGGGMVASAPRQIPVKTALLEQEAPEAASNAINPPCSLPAYSAAAAPGAVLPESL